MTGNARGIQSIEVGGRVLKALVESSQPMMLRDLAQAADLAPAQAHAYLTSLRNVGLVHQDSSSGHYRMGPFAMNLATGWLKSAPRPAAAMQALQGLTEELGHMSLIVVWCEFGPTIVHINAGTAPSALNLRQGTQFSLTGSASGRVFSAFADVADLKERIDAEFQGNGEHHGIGQIASRQAFDDDVAHVRKLGYAVADSVPIPGVNAVAAPVFSAAGHLELVITLIGPSQLLAIGPDSTAVVRLLQTAKAIEQSVIRHVAHETA